MIPELGSLQSCYHYLLFIIIIIIVVAVVHIDINIRNERTAEVTGVAIIYNEPNSTFLSAFECNTGSNTEG